jgi:hypothetical protein
MIWRLAAPYEDILSVMVRLGAMAFFFISEHPLRISLEQGWAMNSDLNSDPPPQRCGKHRCGFDCSRRLDPLG